MIKRGLKLKVKKIRKKRKNSYPNQRKLRKVKILRSLKIKR